MSRLGERSESSRDMERGRENDSPLVIKTVTELDSRPHRMSKQPEQLPGPLHRKPVSTRKGQRS